MPHLPPFRTGRMRREQGHCTPVPSLELPFIILEGATPGPTLLVTAGVHGSEFCSIEAALRVGRMEPEGLKGTLVVLPILNTEGFWRRSIYVMPQDGKNLNRVFPGRPDGTASEQLAHWLVSAVYPQADAYLDLHGGDLDESLVPFSLYPRGSAASQTLAAVFGLPIAVEAGGEGYTINAAGKLGIPSVLAEVSGNGLWDEAGFTALTDGILRVMQHLGMVDLAPPPRPAPRFVTMAVPTAPVTGLWYPAVELDAPVAVGDPLGAIRDVFGAPLAAVRAETAGTILYRLTSLSVNRGEALLGIGTPIDATAPPAAEAALAT